jgi:hypothetical protein
LLKLLVDVSAFSVQSFPLEPLKHLNPMVTDGLPFMLSDPIAFRACLIPSAVDLESRQCRDIGARLLLAESITLLRDRLQDPELSCSDHSIAVVLTLAAAEVSNDDKLTLAEVKYTNWAVYI